MLLLVYVLTLAPDVTFWDAGEFIAAADGFGVPHPPGTPLFIALGRAWSMVLGPVIGVARSMNLLSAVCTAVAGALSAYVVARATSVLPDARWGALAGALCAGLMMSAWANATETEVYALSLAYVLAMLACAQRAGEASREDAHEDRWVRCCAYLIALIPAVHLSALVGAPAVVLLASRRRDGWSLRTAGLLAGASIAGAGVGRMSALLTACGVVTMLASLVYGARAARDADLAGSATVLALSLAVACSAILIMLVRARFDPLVNQGNPSTLTALADVVARRQYDVAPPWPRQAPLWIQLATLFQYVDWQAGYAWGRGIFTTPARILATVVFVLLGAAGWRAMRRDSRPLAEALAVLTLCGSLGVVAYLNLKAGASIGYGFVPASAHEARERDYFFVLAFWGWGLFAGYGALAFIRARGWTAALATMACVIPLVGNWTATDRRSGARAAAARVVAERLLASAPPHAVLFVAGDNDTYPLWYLQQVQRTRRDVQTVTLPLLPADWYVAEVARRTGLRWPAAERVPGARWQHEERAALIARAARQAGRPVAASAVVSASERALLGTQWSLAGAVYVSGGPADGSNQAPFIARSATPDTAPANARRRLPDDMSAMMLAVTECQRLGRIPEARSPLRDSLEVRCNLR